MDTDLPVSFSFYCAYTVFEFPCQMINKAVGPGKTLPIFSFLFGCAGIASAFAFFCSLVFR